MDSGWTADRPGRRLAGAARRSLAAAGARLRGAWLSLVLAAVAAGLSYAIASLLFGSLNAVFAPIAALLTVGLAAGQHLRRAVEITVGVTVGLVAADLLSRLLGVGPLQLALVVLLAMGVAVVLNGGNLMANQAAVAAVLVVGFANVVPWSPLARLGDALIGAVIGLTLHLVFAPARTRAAWQAAGEATELVAASVESSAVAVRTGDRTHASAASAALDGMPAVLTRLDDELAALRDRARLGAGRAAFASVRPLVHLRRMLPTTAGTAVAIARGSANAVRQGAAVPDEVEHALTRLVASIRLLPSSLRPGSTTDAAVELALDAARTASSIPHPARSATASVLIGLIRSAVVDVLRCAGIDHDAAIAELEDAAGRADPRRDDR